MEVGLEAHSIRRMLATSDWWWWLLALGWAHRSSVLAGVTQQMGKSLEVLAAPLRQEVRVAPRLSMAAVWAKRVSPARPSPHTFLAGSFSAAMIFSLSAFLILPGGSRAMLTKNWASCRVRDMVGVAVFTVVTVLSPTGGFTLVLNCPPMFPWGQ